MAGPSRVNRDFPLGDQWRPHEFIFVNRTTIHSISSAWAVASRGRLGSTRKTGAGAGDPCRVGSRPGVGRGREHPPDVYRFTPDFSWRGANYHRPLVTNRAGFNSNRWVFSPGAEVVYRFSLPGSPQRAGALRAAINYYAGGVLRAEASRDGLAWLPVAEFNGEKRGGRADLPAALFPADQVYVRLGQRGQGAGFQVDTFEYEATLQNPPPEAEGQTLFVESQNRDRTSALGWAVGRPRLSMEAIA